ncbi:MAG: hypothetical protein ACREP9_06190, partial [Candidatus Dormibacteraceae bacterium]
NMDSYYDDQRPGRRIGLCGDATRAPPGGCKQQKGRAGFYGSCPAPSLHSLLLEQRKSEKSQGVWGTASPSFAILTPMKNYNWHTAVPLR